MNTNNLASLAAIENLMTVKICFTLSGAEYTYKTTDSSLEPGDMVVVPVKGDSFKIGRVSELDEVPDLVSDDINYKWIVQKVDFNHYEDLIEQEDKAKTSLRKLEQKTLIKQAKQLLADQLGVSVEDVSKELTNNN